MIFIKNGSMSISGTKLTLMAELTTMMKSMVDKDILDEKDLRFLVDTALMSREELHEKIIELDEMCARKNLDREIESFLYSFEMEGSYSYSVCGKVYNLMKDREYFIIDLSNYLDLLHKCMKSRRRLYWKYNFNKPV